MMDKRTITFSCPQNLVDAIDQLAKEEMLSRADVIRRALWWETRAAEMLPRDGKHDDA
jgi:metal-responsive CopG/Arc/MetJ family transcriptional regulator